MSIHYRLQGDVAIITLDRPDRFNAFDVALSQALVASLEEAGEESRAVVLTGAGRAFCSGADLADLVADYQRGGPDLARVLDEIFHPVVGALLSCRAPTVAAVNGPAAGAGFGLALGCDLRVMADSAYMTSAFTAIGLIPDSGTTWWLPHHVGIAKALEITLTNRRISADEAHELGLCTEVVTAEELVERAVEMASDLAELVPDSLVTTRQLIREAAANSFDVALAAERREQARLGKTPEHLEGVAAFVEKRKPDFRNPRAPG
jgi:2-(1,2-epoxy-1,2-dihydrophenyl)acetyl-CoA isomerase